MTDSGQLMARVGRTFEAGDVIFREGEPGDTMFVVQTGQVRITRHGQDGDSTLAVLGAGDFFGEMAILNGRPRTATAEALTELRVLEINARTFGQMVVGNAEIAVRLITRLARRLDAANALVDVLMHRDPKSRLILGLARQADVIGVSLEGRGVLVPISHEELASGVGLTHDEAEDVLVRLRRLRIVEQTEEGFVVGDLDRLREFLEFLSMREKFGDA
jgi:CRP-like cAMP-binding protein